MLSKTSRVPKGLFSHLQGTKEFRSTHLSLRVLPPHLFKKTAISLEKPRFSVVVSKKTAKTASLRNLLRRQVYGVVRFFLPKIQKNAAGVLTIRAIPSPKGRKEVFTGETIELLTKSGLSS